MVERSNLRLNACSAVKDFITSSFPKVSSKKDKNETALSKAELRITTLEEKLHGFLCISEKISELREKISDLNNQNSCIERYMITVRGDIEKLNEKGIAISAMGHGKLRIVTHLDYREVMHTYVMETLAKL